VFTALFDARLMFEFFTILCICSEEDAGPAAPSADGLRRGARVRRANVRLHDQEVVAGAGGRGIEEAQNEEPMEQRSVEEQRRGGAGGGRGGGRGWGRGGKRGGRNGAQEERAEEQDGEVEQRPIGGRRGRRGGPERGRDEEGGEGGGEGRERGLRNLYSLLWRYQCTTRWSRDQSEAGGAGVGVRRGEWAEERGEGEEGGRERGLRSWYSLLWRYQCTLLLALSGQREQ